MPLLLKFLGCAVAFGWIASVALSVAAWPFLRRPWLWRVRTVTRRIGKERIMRIFEDAQQAAPGTPESPELQMLHGQIQEAALAGCRLTHRLVIGLKIAGWALGAAVSWVVFYG